MNFATPVKQVKSCIVCSKSTSGHVRLMKNIALKSIYVDILSVLDVKFPSLDNIYICDTCLTIITKARELREKCKMNLANLSLHQNRQKRVIVHSVSPKVKRVTSLNTTTRKCGKKLFTSYPESDNENKENLKEFSEHSYAGQPKLNVEELYVKHHPLTLKCPITDVTNSNNPMNKVMEIISSGITSLRDFVDKVLLIPGVREAFWSKFVMDLNHEIDRMCVTSEKSVLREKIVDISPELFVENVCREMDQRCPRVFDILVSLCTPVHIKSTQKNPAVAAMYSIALNARNNQMNLMQKLLSAACIRYGAGNGLFHLLSRMGISLPERSKIPMLSDIGLINGKGVCAALTNGRTIKVTVDNIDGRIKANQVRVGSGNKDYHYTHWTVLVDRLLPIDVPELSRQPKVIPPDGLDPNLFFLSDEECAVLKSSYTWLVEKILTEEFTSLSVFKDKVPSVLEHRYRCITDRSSLVHPMFRMNLKIRQQFHWVVTS
ncbi:uncharacterized protein LOC134250012 [Saccostrea cucullata]|uniref:uncharacterized protein LOC134250012 n=1 Tax=Saccostrea cuccullata TaxID=36930 RepID=UPI002ED57925